MPFPLCHPASRENSCLKRAIGLVVEYIVAIDVTRVRFPDGALFVQMVVNVFISLSLNPSARMDLLLHFPRQLRSDSRSFYANYPPA